MMPRMHKMPFNFLRQLLAAVVFFGILVLNVQAAETWLEPLFKFKLATGSQAIESVWYDTPDAAFTAWEATRSAATERTPSTASAG